MGTGTARMRGINAGFGRLASAIAQGSQAEQAAYDQASAGQSRMAQALAAIERDRATAEQTNLQTDMMRARPQVMRDLIAANSGTDGRTVDAFEQKLRTGELVTDFDPATTNRLTQALTRFAPLMGNTGDMNPQQWAQALASFGDQDLQREVVSGDMPTDQRSRGMAVLKASPVFKVPEGFTGDQYSGNIPMDSPVNQAAVKRAASSGAPGAVKEYEFAREQGYAGTFEQWKKANPSGMQTTIDMRQPNAFNTAQGKEFSDLMGTINREAFAAPAQIRKLERMAQLLEGVDGGKLAPVGLEIASWANSVGVKMDPRLGNKEASQALAREMAASFRVPGTGPMTDKDFENFLLQVPDLSKSAEGRAQITKTMRAAANRNIALGKLARDYVARVGQLDNGFIEEAAQFIAENPVVGDMQSWRVER